MDELKPCPFCGNADPMRLKKERWARDPNGFLDAWDAVECMDCRGSAPVRAWNRRAREPASGERDAEQLDLHMMLKEIGHLVNAMDGEEILDAVSSFVEAAKVLGKDALRWEVLFTLHPVDIATEVCGAETSEALRKGLERRVDAAIAGNQKGEAE